MDELVSGLKLDVAAVKFFSVDTVMEHQTVLLEHKTGNHADFLHNGNVLSAKR
jgi:hypothetical protein